MPHLRHCDALKDSEQLSDSGAFLDGKARLEVEEGIAAPRGGFVSQDSGWAA